MACCWDGIQAQATATLAELRDMDGPECFSRHGPGRQVRAKTRRSGADDCRPLDNSRLGWDAFHSSLLIIGAAAERACWPRWLLLLLLLLLLSSSPPPPPQLPSAP